jgi:predicted metalloprotease
MRLDDEQESTSFEDRSSGGGRGFGFPMGGGGLRLGGGRLGCGGIVVVIIIALLLGINPLSLLGDGQLSTPAPQVQAPSAPGADGSTIDPQLRGTILKVLGSTERRWGDIFAANGQSYEKPVLVFYSNNDQSGCGAAQAAMGPFYCPADHRIYLDVSFFDELATRFGAKGDFAGAYVIAHEVGHHIQTITGLSDKVRAAQSRGGQAQGNALQVSMELQADCYAGVWAANDKNLMEPGDMEEGLTAANAIGDDTLQKAAGQRPVPESFTHGTSAQRMQWLKRGLDTGDPAQCDTFKGAF